MTYRLRITETAKQELRRLPGYVRQRARNIAKALADDPRPSEAKELRDMPGRYRIRLVKWRVIARRMTSTEWMTRIRSSWCCASGVR